MDRAASLPADMQPDDVPFPAGLILFQAPPEIAEETLLELLNWFGLEVLVEANHRMNSEPAAPRPRGGALASTQHRLVLTYDFTAARNVMRDPADRSSRAKKTIFRLKHALGREASGRIAALVGDSAILEAIPASRSAEVMALARRAIEGIERAMVPPWPVIRWLSVDTLRSRVALVEHPSCGPSIIKIFRLGALAFHANELEARKRFGHLSLVPELFDHGDNWFLSRFYDNDNAHIRRRIYGTRGAQLTCAAIASLVELLLELRREGYFLLDLSTHNLAHDSRRGLVVLDWEYLQRYTADIPPLAEDFTVVGRPPASAAVQRVVLWPWRRWYDLETAFFPEVVGLPITQLAEAWPKLPCRRIASAQMRRWIMLFVRAGFARVGRSFGGARAGPARPPAISESD